EKVEGVMHFAAISLVGESVEVPLDYLNNNVHGARIVLELMYAFDLKHIVSISSGDTYCEPERVPITEDIPTNPESTYGEPKLIMEKMMKWFDQAYGMTFVALRYFNVSGSTADGSIGQDHKPASHLVPIILQVALGHRYT
ncbi:NAD-dependent epimerase/dehydratase family protein, partial [Listeria monocytogenes]|uniref:NAD-dependent epimerase/dehydratase family protein n=1 Tax=Listeria monocytogenes TaxID=1639 RepID=UPI00057CFAA3